VSPDDVYQVRIEPAFTSRGDAALGDAVLVAPGFAVTTTAALRDAGPVVGLRAPGSDAPVAAEVVEVLGSEERVLLEVAAPGFDVPFNPSTAGQLLRFRAGRLLADLKWGGGETREVSTMGVESAGAGGTLLLAYLWERARTGRLDPVVTVPALEGSR
jgi:hypothetical protein